MAMGLFSPMFFVMFLMVGASSNLRSRPATNTTTALSAGAALHCDDWLIEQDKKKRKRSVGASTKYRGLSMNPDSKMGDQVLKLRQHLPKQHASITPLSWIAMLTLYQWTAP